MAKISRIKSPRQKRKRSGPLEILRAAVLPLLPLPFAAFIPFPFFTGNIHNTWLSLLSLFFSLCASLSLWLGRAQENQYEGTKPSSIQGIPFKTIAALLYGLATAILTYQISSHSIVKTIFTCLLITICFTFFFGRDRYRTNKKSLSSPLPFQLLLDNAANHILELQSVANEVDDNNLRDRINKLTLVAERIVVLVEGQKEERHPPRKFFRTYLPDAVQIIKDFTENNAIQKNKSDLQHEFDNLLTSLEGVFLSEYNRLQQKKEMEIDIQMKVLQTRLKE